MRAINAKPVPERRGAEFKEIVEVVLIYEVQTRHENANGTRQD